MASDADQPNTLHTKIAYSLIKQEPNNGKLFFAVNKDSGIISVNDPTLDREVIASSYTGIYMCDYVSVVSKELLPNFWDCLSSNSVEQDHSSYVLTVQAADMYGGPQGRSTTATLSVDLLDVNDNVPTLEKDEVTICIG